MSPVRPCLACGTLTDKSRCARCAAGRVTRRTPGRTAPAAFRSAVLADAGGRCQAIIAGQRCDVDDAAVLEAHHVVALRAGGSNTPDNGVALCRAHHRLAERLAVDAAAAAAAASVS